MISRQYKTNFIAIGSSMLFVLLGTSIVGIGPFEILVQATNATNSTNATSVSGVGGIPVTYPLESFSTTYKKLSSDEIKSELSKLEGWKIINGKLTKSFEFNNFIEAFGFMTKVAIETEKMNHHPEWFNIYNQLKIDLVTHDVNGISNFDIKLANAINKIQGGDNK